MDNEILHSGEGGDVERWLEPRKKFIGFVIACLLIYIPLVCLHLCCCFSYTFYLLLALHSSLHHFYHSRLSVFTHLNKKAIEHLNL